MKEISFFFVVVLPYLVLRPDKFEEAVKLNLSVDFFWELKNIFCFFSFILALMLNIIFTIFIGNGFCWTFIIICIELPLQRYLLLLLLPLQRGTHSVKGVQIWSLFWSIFSRIRTKYEYLGSKSPYSVRTCDNTDQKKLRPWPPFTQWFLELMLVE